MLGLLRKLLFVLLSLLTVLAMAWTFGALVYDGPSVAAGGWNFLLAVLWLTSVIIIAKKASFAHFWQLRLLLCCLPVYVYWLSLRPSNDRDWQAEFAQTGYVDIHPDHNTLTFHNVRNFDYVDNDTPTGIVTERWETRTYHLDQLRGIDLHLDAFGGNLIAHPMLSFNFGPEGHLVLSIETRRESTEEFSALGGIYKMFELQYIFGTESDLVRLRTNIRKEPLYIYRSTATPEETRGLLLECIHSQNAMKDHPRWYNAVTHNCTTSYRAQTPVKDRHYFDWRLLVNGQLDRMLYEKKALVTDGLTFKDLRAQAHINEAAEAHPEAKGFSEAIRKGRAGFSSQ
jgi:hypothetical protein